MFGRLDGVKFEEDGAFITLNRSGEALSARLEIPEYDAYYTGTLQNVVAKDGEITATTSVRYIFINIRASFLIIPEDTHARVKVELLPKELFSDYEFTDVMVPYNDI